MSDQIKIGREMIDLVDGDEIMDNGSCLQLISRGTWGTASPRVSKAAFVVFKSLANVSEVKKHEYRNGSTLWRYSASGWVDKQIAFGDEVLYVDEKMHKMLNILAWKFYAVLGHNQVEDFDFFASKNRMEYKMYIMALEAYMFNKNVGME